MRSCLLDILRNPIHLLNLHFLASSLQNFSNKAGYARCLFLLFLASCSYRTNHNVQDLSVTKQKQKIVLLQKKLQVREKEQAKIQSEIDRLNDDLGTVQLAYIRNKLDEFEAQLWRDPRKRFYIDSANLFTDEREVLHQMIQSGHAIFEAQIVLDRILQLITELSNYAN